MQRVVCIEKKLVLKWCGHVGREDDPGHGGIRWMKTWRGKFWRVATGKTNKS